MELSAFCVNGSCLFRSARPQISALSLSGLVGRWIYNITIGRGNTFDSKCVSSDRGCKISLRSRTVLNYKHVPTERSGKVSRGRVGVAFQLNEETNLT